MIEVNIENIEKKVRYPFGTTLSEICSDLNIKSEYPILGARVNNKLKELSYKIFKPKQIKFIDVSDKDGYKMYIRSLIFVLIKAVKDIYPNGIVKIEHAVSKGLYCEIVGIGDEVTIEMTIKIVKRMHEIIEADIPFSREEVQTKDAIELFKKNKLFEKARLFKSRVRLYTSVYRLDDLIDYFYGYLVPSTRFLKVFDLVKYYDGMLLMLPKPNQPEEIEDLILQSKLFEIFQEYKNWGEILGVESIGSINEAVAEKRVGELIKVAEALHEKKVSQIADRINGKRKKVRLILISGPSSSGKTTFTKRLAIQLKVLGISTLQMSLDNYFVNRENTPIDENGEYNFEAIEALDVKLFNENLIDLFSGKEVNMPKFSFETGERYYNDEVLKIDEDQLILVEGIHGLNPKLTEMIDSEMKFKIYVSALTQMGIDNHNRIPTNDNRLLRRMVRDYRYRGYSALDTLRRWPSVRAGEEKYIFPFQEEANVMFNSALLFELGVLKNYAVPLLEDIQENDEVYSEATRLLKFLSYFKSIEPKEIPPTSILREFLEGSSFDYN
jgi:uridine kinase